MLLEYQEFKQILFDFTRQIGENTNAYFNAVGTRYQLTMIQIRILMELYHNGSHTMGSLAESVHMADANISAMCKKMEKRGIVIRRRDADDERIVRIELSDSGNLIMKEINRSIDLSIARALATESEESQETIVQGLIKFNHLLEKIVKEYEILMRGGQR